MKPRFGLTELGRREIVQGILSPEEWRFLSLPWRCRPQRRSGAAWRNNANALHFAKNIEGMEPGEILPLTLATDEGNRKQRYFHFIVM